MVANLRAGITSLNVAPSSSGGTLGVSTDGMTGVVYKDFNPPVGLGPVDVVVTVNTPGDYNISENTYGSWNGFVHNISGQDWSDFHFQILEPGAAFTAINYDVFTDHSLAPSTIDLFNGTVPVSTDFHPVLTVQVGDVAEFPYTFTIRETATVPEPSTLALLFVSAIGLLGCRTYVWASGKNVDNPCRRDCPRSK